MRPRPILLLILDGFGHREDSADNAIALADCPNWRRLLATCPNTLVQTHGLRVGLPDDQMGNSEVGHMNIGAGRVVYQDLTRIDADIASGGFRHNAALRQACAAARAGSGTLHLLGLVSPGGVHSQEEHIHAMLDLAREEHVPHVVVHAFLDGRDTPPRSAGPSLERLEAKCREVGNARIATVTGRYYAMDRDQRWDRVELAWRALVDAHAEHAAPDATSALAQGYARGEGDEFVRPTVLSGTGPMRDGDAVLHLNFRADRARQLSAAFVRDDFAGFLRPRRPALSAYVTLTEYAKDLPVSAVAYPPQSMRNALPEYLSGLGLTQLRIAETEKYAHVTFFFNGGREQPYPGEERILVPSPRVATYDLKPEMSCPEVTEKLCEAIRSRRFDFIVCNLANADMVGHTGMLDAAIAAVETLDRAIGDVVTALGEVGGEMLLSADHGNLELMRDQQTGEPHTAHTLGPVPLVYFGRRARLRGDGALCDLAPSVLHLMGLPQPGEMSGHNLIELG